jgi:hypothetical protein
MRSDIYRLEETIVNRNSLDITKTAYGQPDINKNKNNNIETKYGAWETKEFFRI